MTILNYSALLDLLGSLYAAVRAHAIHGDVIPNDLDPGLVDDQALAVGATPALIVEFRSDLFHLRKVESADLREIVMLVVVADVEAHVVERAVVRIRLLAH